MRRIVEFVDWAARLHFIGTLAWTFGGWAVTFFGLSAIGWDPGAVWLGSLVAGACCALIFIAVRTMGGPAHPEIITARPSMAEIPNRKPARRAKIVFGTDDPFVTVARSGVNRSRTVRVKVQNESDEEISNGTMSVLNLDPPSRGHQDFFLKGDIRIGPHRHVFVDVAAYSEGTTQAKPGPWIRLLIPLPPGGFLFNGLPGNLPVAPHTFHLQFSTLEDRVLNEVYCRLSVDENHILRLQDWGNSLDVPRNSEAQEISLMEAVTRTYEGIKDKPISIVVEGLANSPDDILTWLCNALTRSQDGNEPLVTLRGNKPPSRLKEEIYMAPLSRYDFIVEGQAIAFQERDGKMRYEGLSVNASELESAIQSLAKRDV